MTYCLCIFYYWYEEEEKILSKPIGGGKEWDTFGFSAKALYLIEKYSKWSVCDLSEDHLKLEEKLHRDRLVWCENLIHYGVAARETYRKDRAAGVLSGAAESR